MSVNSGFAAESGESKYSTPHWFKLDNAANIYPASRTRNYVCMYRIGFIMKEDVNPVLLQQAVDDIAPRFPSFFVQLRTGLFWSYLERVDDTKVVVEETECPCHGISIIDSDKPAFRIVYYKRRIAAEIFHSIADGGACVTMLKTLVARYLELQGYEIPKDDSDLLDISEEPKENEHDDAFQKIAKKKVPAPAKEPTSYQYKVKPIPNYFEAVHGILPVSDLKAQCKPMGLSITEYLAAVFLYSLYLDNPKNKKPIRISIPISLRPVFGYQTLRNFSSFANIGFVPKKNGETTFEYIVESIRGKIKEELSPDNLLIPISRNVNSSKVPLLRFVPNLIKRPILKAAFVFVGQKKFVCSMTNLGVCKMPEEMGKHIDRMEVLLGGAPQERISCAIGSLGDTLNFAFTSPSKKIDVQREFFRFLSSHGVRVRVESSDREAWEQ